MTWTCSFQPVALDAYDSVVDPFRCSALAEQIASAPSPCQSGVGRDGVELSWWISADARIESIREHEQRLEVPRDVYSELLECFPKHA